MTLIKPEVWKVTYRLWVIDAQWLNMDNWHAKYQEYIYKSNEELFSTEAKDSRSFFILCIHHK